MRDWKEEDFAADVRIRIKIVSVRHVDREAEARSTKRVFHNLEMAHIKFDSSMQK